MIDQNLKNIPAEKGKESFALARTRVIVSVLAGLVSGGLVGIFISWKYAPLAAWDVAALIFLIWLWLALHNLDSEQTARLAVREDPNRGTFDLLLILASVASLAAVGVLLFQANNSNGTGELLQIGLGVISVIISWAVIHSIYALRYAEVYYKNNGGIDFYSTVPPCYSDFAYIAFTIGMTFQISDNNIQTPEFRKIALRHALLSYLFGTVIVAAAINLIAGLRK